MITRKETESETKTMWVYLFGFLLCLTSILFGYFRSGHNKEKNKTKRSYKSNVNLDEGAGEKLVDKLITT